MIDKKCFLVRTLGYWGRGASILEAARTCYKAGARRADRTVVNLIIGDNEPCVNSLGEVLRAPSSHNLDIASGLTLSALLKLK